MQKPKIVGLSLPEIELLVSKYGYGKPIAEKICKWIYRKGCTSFALMDDIPKDIKETLGEDFSLDRLEPVEVQYSSDGTQKFLYKTSNGNPFETAYIPGGRRNTLCLSTQSGCRMECSFCHTGTIGFRENLSTADIVLQLLSNPNLAKINRLVLMGMGEPLDNADKVFKALRIFTSQWGMAFGVANITLSTVGILPELPRFVNSKMCNIAISLHSPFSEQRQAMIPVENTYPIEQVVEFFRQNPLKKPLRLSFEYVVVPLENDSDQHAAATVALLKDIISHVNVIPLNTMKASLEVLEAAKAFQRKLNHLGQPTTLRESRGQDINAACGMMAGKNKQ